MEILRFIKDRSETEWGYQLPDGRIIDLLDEEGHFFVKYDRPFNLQTGEVFPYNTHPEGSVTLNDLNKQGGKTVHCYNEVDLNYSAKFKLNEKNFNVSGNSSPNTAITSPQRPSHTNTNAGALA